MEIVYFDTLDSTQLCAKELLMKKKPPFGVVSKEQTRGIGSRGNSWSSAKEGLYMSGVFLKTMFPDDMPLHSTSLYIGANIVVFLRELGSKVWMKWPNDLYIDNKKVGGIITEVVQGSIVWGVGINLKNSSQKYASLDVDISSKKLAEGLFKQILKKRGWKEIFRIVDVEFHKSKEFDTSFGESRVSLADAVLNSDGSIMVDGIRKFSLR